MTGGFRTLLVSVTAVAGATYMTRQCRRPTGWLGRCVLYLMNHTHRNLTAWGLRHITVNPADVVLDIGCGGGGTVEKLAALAPQGSVFGVDCAEASMAAARAHNLAGITSGHISLQQANVSQLPFADRSFHVVTAVETHYYWPNHLQDLREIYRVLKPGGTVLLVAEAFRGQRLDFLNTLVMQLLGGSYLSSEEHLKLLRDAGFTSTKAFVEDANGWICVTGRRVP